MSDSGKRAALGAAGGFGIGIWVGSIMAILGLLACLTGIGIVIGIPLILIGAVMPVLLGARGAGDNLSPEELEELNRKSARFANVGGLVCLAFFVGLIVWLAWTLNG